jgi:membrane-associated phospholipid phosphatase
MDRRRVREFVGRRFAREYYLGLHVTLGAVLCLLTLTGFLAIASQVTHPTFLTHLDESLGLRLRDHRLATPTSREVFLIITEIGSITAMTIVAIGCALLLWRRRSYGLALCCLLIPLSGGLIDLGLKTFVDRPRPEFKDKAVPETNESYPSGHSMGSLIGYGMVAYLCVLFLPRPGLRYAALGCLAVIVVLIGFSRIYLGAHFFSDVLGGYTVGAAWLAACLTVLEVLRRRPAAGGKGHGGEPVRAD